MGRIIAIDYGNKRTGLAVTDELKIIATSLGTVATAKVKEFLANYLKQNTVECFVVGEPKQMNGEASQIKPQVEKFISLLAKSFPQIPIKRADERFTSLMASRTLLDMGLKKKDRSKKENIDQISAVIILQSFLEQNK